jgi:hypothetical protein
MSASKRYIAIAFKATESTMASARVEGNRSRAKPIERQINPKRSSRSKSG